VVCLFDDGQAPALVEEALRMQRQLGGRCTVIALERPMAYPPGSAQAGARRGLLEALIAAEQAGAGTRRLTIGGRSARAIAQAVAERARREHATRLLVAPPAVTAPVWRAEGERLANFVDELARALPGVQLHVVVTGAAAVAPAASVTMPRRPLLHQARTVLLALGACTLVADVLLGLVEPSGLLAVYLAGVVFVALREGSRASLATLAGSIVLFDLLQVAPRWSIKPTEPQYYLLFLLMGVLGVVVGELAAQSQRHRRLAEARAQRNHALNRQALALVRASDVPAVAVALAEAVTLAVGRRAALLPMTPDSAAQVDGDMGHDVAGGGSAREPVDGPDAAPALPLPDNSWFGAGSAARRRAGEALAAAAAQRRSTGAGTAVAPDAGVRCMPLLTGDDAVAALLVLEMVPDAAPLSIEDEGLLAAFANQAALALERLRAEQQRADAALQAEAERTHHTLLAALAHDLRTPLTTIVGSTAAVLEQGAAIDGAGQRALLQSVLDAARALSAQATDLLDLSRMQAGAWRAAPQWCPADELLDEALAPLRPALREAALTLDVTPDCIVWCDPALVMRLIANLVANALRHAAGAPIQVAIHQGEGHWALRVADRGPGFAHRASRRHGDGSVARPGLGLVLCRTIVRLHGGTLELRDDHGALALARLPQPHDGPGQALEDTAAAAAGARGVDRSA
jgi:two-component system sensor histidine kinase KdpD